MDNLDSDFSHFEYSELSGSSENSVRSEIAEEGANKTEINDPAANTTLMN